MPSERSGYRRPPEPPAPLRVDAGAYRVSLASALETIGQPPSQVGSPVELVALVQMSRRGVCFPAPYVRVSARSGLGCLS